MIERLYTKELLGFKSVELNFESGLVVITGPSGAGKSVLISSLLANFGLANQEAKLCEVELKKPKGLDSVEFELEDYIVIKALKKDRVRLFLDGQNISKKALKELFKGYISYISVRDKSGFESDNLIALIDGYIAKDNFKHTEVLAKYGEKYREYRAKEAELKEIENRVKEANERVEFLKFEIDKIKNINPQEGEYEELLLIKKQLSKIDRITEIANKTEDIFSFEDNIYELFTMLGKDSSYFSDAMNQLRSDFDDIVALSDSTLVLPILKAISSMPKSYNSTLLKLKFARGSFNSFK